MRARATATVLTALQNAVRRARFNVAVTRSTSPEQLDAFFNGVRPLATDHPLIRIGGEGDGGYLIPDDLEGISTCFSPGVSTTADFELELARRGIRSFLADYSVDAPPVQHPLFRFEKKYLGREDDGRHVTLEDWVARSSDAGDRDLLLQMDIEDSEYDVLLATSSATLRRFRIVVIEFHRLEYLFDKLGYRLIGGVFAKLLADFAVVHVHPNNASMRHRLGRFEVPSLAEFTLLRRDRIAHAEPATTFPHTLDRPNAPELEDFPLPRCWYDR